MELNTEQGTPMLKRGARRWSLIKLLMKMNMDKNHSILDFQKDHVPKYYWSKGPTNQLHTLYSSEQDWD